MFGKRLVRRAALGVIALLAPATAVAQATFIAADGVPIQYVKRGNGPPLVLIHGFAVDAGMNWIQPGTLDTLARDFTVIAPDLRGHGASGKPHDPQAYGARLADDIVALLDHLEIPRAHLVGYSMGAGVALRLVTMHPDRARSIVIGGGGWSPPEAPPPAFVMRWFVALDSAARNHTSVAEALAQPGFPPIPPEMKPGLDRNDPAALLAVLRGFGGLIVSDSAVRAIKTPMLVLAGARDSIVLESAQRIAAMVPGATLTLLPGDDHVTALRDPRLALAIRQFTLRR
jgi:pimeloyl-ACP methyl ester carboxylesterase